MCRTKPEFFRTIQQALEFPDYFGHNWDAFNECISDLLDLSEGGMGAAFGGRPGKQADTLEIKFWHADQLLTNEPMEVLMILLRILRANIQASYQDRTAQLAKLRIVLHCPSDERSALLARLSSAGVKDEDYAND